MSTEIFSVLASSVGFIFGGCCSNVFSLESLVKDAPASSNIGSFITFCQFCFIASQYITKVFYLDHKYQMVRMKDLNVPFKVYLVSVSLYFLGTLGNNSVFIFDISIPLHIVFRSSSTVITMIIGWLFAGKRYNKYQVLSAIILTIGVIITTLYKDDDLSLDELYSNSVNLLNPLTKAGKKSMIIDQSSPESVQPVFLEKYKFVCGVIILLSSSIMMSILSLYNEWTYKTYGKHWEENIFYTHLLSIPLFLITSSSSIFGSVKYLLSSKIATKRSWRISMFLGNLVTQNMCVKGVNKLASTTNALTVSVVLLLRKFISLILSIHFFGSTMSRTGYFGAGLVFLGAMMYALSSKSDFEDEEKEHQKELKESRKER
ncbi:Yea4p SCDLUD_005156 [Saccharomycodes ludwigii]|uniref:Yea4p n=1 Tax=Saccharomycodes ludwigii TaxID=36035 RepID=UPI001E8B8F00|nr:hypothetical protein SCDLUD_005156 [Saccharomycodes ludwigii]KAH3898818.1 hypothetical protein SCDLUD_005156 [Saccharomycodes ludwigii]